MKGTVFIMTIIILYGSISSTQAQAQWSLTGNVGTNPTTDFIGTTDGSSISIRTNNFESIRILPGSANWPGSLIYNPGTYSNNQLYNYGPGLTVISTGTAGAHLNLVNPNNIDWTSQIRFYGSNGIRHNIIDDGGLTFNTTANNGAKDQVRFTGKVIVGSPNLALNTANYRLYVEDGIITEKIKVAIYGSTTSWPDYVFAKDYNLLPLTEVEQYIKENNHLPKVPSADDMVTQGLNVAEMDAKLLEKIEELTLYMIDLKKENQKLAQEIELLKEEIR